MARDDGESRPISEEEQAKAHLAAIVDSSDDGIISKTLDGVVRSWNRGAESLYGYARAEAVGRHISFLVPEERLDELRQITERVVRGERVEHMETVRITKDGRRIWVSLTLSPILAADGVIVGVSTIARDITERMRMERSLRESEKRYRTLVEMAPDAVVVHQEGRFVYANCAALGIYGARELAQLQQVTVLELIHPDERQSARERIQQLLDGEEIPLREYRLLRLDGRSVDVEASSTLIDYQGRPSIQIIARDITARKRAEQQRDATMKELAFERARFETVIRQMPVGVMIAEAPQGRLLYCNEQSWQIFRFPPQAESLTDYRQWKIYGRDGSVLPAQMCPLARSLKGETLIREELEIGRGDGSRGFVSVNASPIRDAVGQIVSGVVSFNDITESRAAAKALSDSEERLKLALDAAEMGACDMVLETGSGLWSRRHFLLFGYEPPASDPAPASIDMWQSRIHPDDRERVSRELGGAKREGSIFRSEHRIIRVDNQEVVWVNVQGRFICEPQEPDCRFIGMISDVTERRNQEEALRRSERRFRQMADSMPQIAWTADPDGKVDYLNMHFELYTGMERGSQQTGFKEAHPGQRISDIVHPDDLEQTTRAWRQAIGSGEIFQSELRIRRVDGVYRWHLGRAIPERDENGRIVKWYGTGTDINDLREMQEKLRASEAKFRWIYDSNLVAIFFWRKDGSVIESNQAFCDLVGHSAEECHAGSLNWLELTPQELRPRDRAAIEEVMARGMCKPYEKEFINSREGNRVSVLIAGAKVVGTEGDGIAFSVDLSELKHAEEALKQSESNLKLAVEITGLGIFDLDLRTGKGVWSDIAKRHYGLPPEADADLEILLAGVHPEDRAHIERIAKDACKREGAGSYGAEYRTIGIADGKLRWLTMRARVTRNEHGEPVRLSGACLDISDIVRAEKALKDEINERLRTVEELRRQEQLLIRQGRLAAMGEMIGNIAHQWRQPLNTLALIVQEFPVYYQRNLLNKEYLDASVTRAMQVINYMSKTIDGFRNFFGPGKEKEAFRAGEVLARTVSIVEAAFNELNLKIEVSADPEIVIYGNPNEFSQVILNILMNAKDAILERRVVQPKVAVNLFSEPGKAVLTIADNAGGIAPEIIDRIFDPYFTTKGPDRGTGIGLFMSKTIIEKNMNGALTVRNTGTGAEFRIEVSHGNNLRNP